MGVLRGLQGFLCSTLERTPATPHLAPGLKEVSPTHCLSSVMHLGSCWAHHSPSRIGARIRILFCVYKTSKWGPGSPCWRLPCPGYRITLPGASSPPLLEGWHQEGGLEKQEMQCWNSRSPWKLQASLRSSKILEQFFSYASAELHMIEILLCKSHS